jgi:fumarate hydratase subunit beta
MSEGRIRLEGPLTRESLAGLRAGDAVSLSGTIYTARDAAHKRICETLDAGEEPPFPIAGSVIYYAGPAPAQPGRPIGPVGPTSSYRMDPFAPRLMDLGMRAMIGKGTRSAEVVDAIVRNGCVYFGAVGGAAALIARSVRSAEVIAYEDLGTEAIRKLEVVDMPLTVVIDATGTNLYETGPAAWRAEREARTGRTGRRSER